MRLPYADRAEAGRVLAEALTRYDDRDDVLVLALPRGGVPVAFEVAKALGAPMDLLLVRKLGVPGQEELAMGAIASGGAIVVNEDILRATGMTQLGLQYMVTRERAELHRREQAYRGARPLPDVAGRCLLLIDDGLATGASMRAAAAALRQRNPGQIVVAVPVAPEETVAAFRHEVDDIVCPATPTTFYGVGQWYVDFAQVPDEEVRRLLQQAWEREKAQSSR